ncbi:MAG: hypothetical protein KAT68_15750 [Bacteroidales bacterium]|nr:hypothetical protein [Bacteroidales bacterium]
MEIIFKQHKNIDRVKWDRCINKAYNGIIYTYSWYLDIVCHDWDGLIVGDYDIVMPLTKFKKFGINYLAQPFYTQQLGVFSTKKTSPKVIEDFLSSIPSKYKYIEINLNTFNNIGATDFKINRNVTYEIDLIKPYEKTYKKYSLNTKRNIKKAVKNKISIIRGLPVSEIIDFKRKNTKNKLSETYFYILKKIISFSLLHKIGEIYGAYTHDNELCAATFFIRSHHKAIYLLSVSSTKGKENSAMFLLIDKFMKNNSEKNLTLDFEGSNIESIARFFNSFGAKPCYYYTVKKNNLLWILKMFKR